MLKKLLPLVLLSVLSLGMLVGRAVYTENLRFVFLVWNLFLAWIPVVAAAGLVRSRGSWWAVGVLGTVGLLFLPNAPYLTADLIHLRPRTDAPLWFDALMLTTFAMTGVAIGFSAIHWVHDWCTQRFSAWVGGFVSAVATLLCGYGLYLGRVERYNSWDSLLAPRGLFLDVVSHLTDPWSHLDVWKFTLVYGVWMAVLYVAWRAGVAAYRAPRVES